MSSPLRGPELPLGRPPKNMEKMSSGLCIEPSSSPSLPNWSYRRRFSGSDSTSYAIVISLNFSGSPPLSGWFFRASFLYAWGSDGPRAGA
jgi:hypothetical protein